jgi:hypothetical protein
MKISVSSVCCVPRLTGLWSRRYGGATLRKGTQRPMALDTRDTPQATHRIVIGP